MMISYNIDIFYQIGREIFFAFDAVQTSEFFHLPVWWNIQKSYRKKTDRRSKLTVRADEVRQWVIGSGGGLLFIIFWAVNRYAVTQLLIGQVDVAFDTVIGCRCCLFPCLFVFCCVLKNSRFYFVVSDFRTGSPAVGPNPRCLPDFSHSGSTFWVF